MHKIEEINTTTFQGRINLEKVKTLIPYMKSYNKKMALGICSGTLNQVFSITSSALAAYLVGLAATGGSAEKILSLFWLLAALAIGRTAMVYAEMYLVHDVAYSILVDYRNIMYRAIERIAPAYMLKKRSGDIASSVMADVEVLEVFYAHTVGAYIIAIIAPLTFLVILAYIHWLLPLVIFPFLLLVATIPFWFSKKASQQGKEIRAKLGTVNAEVVDGVQGMREIVAFGRGKSYLKKLENGTYDLGRSQIAEGKRLGLEGGLINAAMSLGMVSILAVSSFLVLEGTIDSALIPTIIMLSVYVFSPIVDVSGTARNLGSIGASAQRVFSILNTPTPVEDKAEATSEGPIVSHIQYNKVKFSYNPSEEDVLKEVSFDVKPGETVALVGHSGAGKTTCANLLLRFWDVRGGSIKIGDYDLRDLTQEKLRDMVAVVSQDVYLFNMSIRENIRLGKPEATDEEVEAASKLALAHDFLVKLPQGYETNVGERGVQLSGGQRQRIAIARALIKNSPILLMDEAVSNLDAENERAVQKAISELQKGRTTLVIAHRLSTIMAADKIVVLDKGKVAEIGSHDALVKKNGVYSRLIASQNIGVLE
ncbi:thiol reductant ABC exporter subunit CydC [Clostridium formicaceticum]|nr:thiol reductant ABC exporter subunit CydC [Clostridium formicaceticum]